MGHLVVVYSLAVGCLERRLDYPFCSRASMHCSLHVQDTCVISLLFYLRALAMRTS